MQQLLSNSQKIERIKELSAQIVALYYCKKDVEQIIRYFDHTFSWFGPKEAQYAVGKTQAAFLLRHFVEAIPPCTIENSYYDVLELSPGFFISTGRVWITGVNAPASSPRICQRVSLVFRWQEQEEPKCCHIHCSSPWGSLSKASAGSVPENEQTYDTILRNLRDLEEEMQSKNTLLQNIYDTVPCLILRFRRRKGQYKLLFSNRYAADFFRSDTTSVQMQDWRSGISQIVHPEDRAELQQALNSLELPGDKVTTQFRVIRPDGTLHRMFGSASIVSEDETGQIIQRFLYDATAEHAAIAQLQQRLALENAVLVCVRALTHESDSEDAVDLFLKTIGEYYMAKRAFIFEFDLSKRIVQNTQEWCATAVNPKRSYLQNIPFADFADWIEKFRQHECVHIPVVSKMKGNDVLRERFQSLGIQSILVAPIYHKEELIGFLGVDDPDMFADDPALLTMTADFISEEFLKRVLLRDVEDLSYIDRLTGLWNRNKYAEVLEVYKNTPFHSMGVFFIDLDGLKEINETGGHDIGDQFICQCADIIRDFDADVFRIDGDEFVVLFPDVAETTFRQQEITLRRSLKKLPSGSGSLGAVWEQGRINIPAMVSQADELMYAEKQIYYRTVAHKTNVHRLGIAADILTDIQNRRFEVFFQPQVNLRTGMLYGAEALVRKRDAQGKIIPPDHFIPLYESDGIISHMDLHVFELVCGYIRTWKQELNVSPKISVNFSRVTLMEEGIVSSIISICEKYDVPPAQIMIEVTESIGKLSHEQLKQLVISLQEAGFSVSLDDFGSRYSNLSILTSIDFQLIKLDKSLIDNIEVDQKNAQMTRTLLSLCKDTLETASLAEGVETLAQAQTLQTFSCDYVQGYYFSRPIPAADFTDLLRSNHQFTI